MARPDAGRGGGGGDGGGVSGETASALPGRGRRRRHCAPLELDARKGEVWSPVLPIPSLCGRLGPRLPAAAAAVAAAAAAVAALRPAQPGPRAPPPQAAPNAQARALAAPDRKSVV